MTQRLRIVRLFFVSISLGMIFTGMLGPLLAHAQGPDSPHALVMTVDGKRCAAIEILINTPHIAELILKGALDEIKEAMESSGQKGMQTFDAALFDLYNDGRIELDEALNNADSRTNLEAKINFG